MQSGPLWKYRRQTDGTPGSLPVLAVETRHGSAIASGAVPVRPIQIDFNFNIDLEEWQLTRLVDD